jgi:uncharacterized Zn-binding protein involved in type VI secretion
MPNAARVGDNHVCPKVEGVVPHVGGPVLTGSADVLIDSLPAARATDDAFCAVGGPDKIAQGCGTVLINSLFAARTTDLCVHGGALMAGSASVAIGAVGDAVPVLPVEHSEDARAGEHGAPGRAAGGDGSGGDARQRPGAGAQPQGSTAREPLPIPEIVGHHRIKRDIFQHSPLLRRQLIVDGDTVIVSVWGTQDPRVTALEIEIANGDARSTAVSNETHRASFTANWVMNEKWAPVELTLRARWNGGGLHSDWSAPYTAVRVLPYLGRSGAVWFADLVRRIGFEAALGWSFGGGPVGALTNVAGMMVKEGLQQLGLHPVAAGILAASTQVFSAAAGAILNPSSPAIATVRSIIPAVYRSEVSMGVSPRLAFDRAVEVCEHLQWTILGNAALKAAVKEALAELREVVIDKATDAADAR